MTELHTHVLGNTKRSLYQIIVCIKNTKCVLKICLMVHMQLGVAVAKTAKRYFLCLPCLKFKTSINTDCASPRALETRSVSD